MFRSTPSSPAQKKGLYYERVALRHLRRQGLDLLTRNYHCRCGEIDLILKDGDTIVFAEVRYRGDSRHGSALETIGAGKRRKLIRTAEHFLLTSHLLDKHPGRFDVIGVTCHEAGPTVHWVRDAFRP